MIEKLSKKDKKWRLYALKICGDKTLCDDLVNDMYIKVHDSKMDLSNKKDSYFYTMIYHLFIDNKRKTKNIKQLNDFSFIESEPADDGLKNRLMITEALEELHFFDCEILLHTHERSLRDNEELLGVQFTKLHYWKKKAIEKIKRTETIKEFRKLRNK